MAQYDAFPFNAAEGASATGDGQAEKRNLWHVETQICQFDFAVESFAEVRDGLFADIGLVSDCQNAGGYQQHNKAA